MKTTAALVALMAAGAVAQPHIHARHAHPQHHRDLQEREEGKTKTDWVTEWVTQYVTVDGPAPQHTEAAAESPNASPGNFKDMPSPKEETKAEETTSSTPTSTPEPEPTTTKAPPPKKTTSTTQAPPPSETLAAETPAVETPVIETPTVKKPEPTNAGNGGGNSGGSGGGSGEAHSGFITYYQIGLGACGFTDTVGGTGSFDNPMVVAISKNVFFDGLVNPNNMELCNRKIVIQSDNKPGVKAYGIIRDACQACTTAGDIDVNIEGMSNFYDDPVAVGKGSITWSLA